ncbi:hypothetical protein MTR_5g056700 [Medicago truncatula]|uniref:Uncharacterized protein n=1 Tax=Medicago truncatula TaxID=3880 RepID=G7K1L1_MEDTR|nr:hypothetical protein MTR_5g056700 [Medicago truncatula]
MQLATASNLTRHSELGQRAWSNIILMSIETLKKIEGLRTTPAKKLVGVADGTLHEPEGVLFNVQVEVENFKLLTDIVLMDTDEYPVTLGRPFLATSKAQINLEHK